MKTTQLKLITGALLALTLIASPTLSLAKEKEQKDRDREDRSCLKAFGHLIAPGFIKKSGTASTSDDCKLPFGISKKMQNRNASTTADVTAPVISNLLVKIQSNSKVDVRWDTNEKTIGAIFFGTTTPVLTQTPTTSTSSKKLIGVTSTNSSRLVDFDYDNNHKIRIKGLNASTTYYVVAVSRDRAGNTSISTPVSFTTKVNVNNDTSPIISNIITSAGSSTVSVSWKTNELATSKLFYGTSTLSTSTSLNVSDSTLKKDHSLTLSGLATSTTYRLIVQSTNAAGNMTVSNEFMVSTSI